MSNRALASPETQGERRPPQDPIELYAQYLEDLKSAKEKAEAGLGWDQVSYSDRVLRMPVDLDRLEELREVFEWQLDLARVRTESPDAPYKLPLLVTDKVRNVARIAFTPIYNLGDGSVLCTD